MADLKKPDSTKPPAPPVERAVPPQATTTRAVLPGDRVFVAELPKEGPQGPVPEGAEKDSDGTFSNPASPPPAPRDNPPPASVPTVTDQPMMEPKEFPEVTSGTFRLDADHYWIGDVMLPKDTLVGDDTDYPLYPGFRPSTNMTEVTGGRVPARPRERGIPGQGGRTR